MPTWNDIDSRITSRTTSERVEPVCLEERANALSELANYTKRPTIAYYSGFLQKKSADGKPHPESAITDFDMNGFMANCYRLNQETGLDLIIHTPGGATEATRAIVGYLYKMFGRNIRVIVPQLAQSAGTMIACAASDIVLGKHSCLGPTDPQIGGAPAMGVLHEIDKALEEIRERPDRNLFWQHVFAKYPPTFISNCERAIAGTKQMISEWLRDGMFAGDPDQAAKVNAVVNGLMNYVDTSEHGHHFSPEDCHNFGMKIVPLEEDQRLQELVLTVHHTYVASFARLPVIKFIENSIGTTWTIEDARSI